jgi:hypothetical protein
MKARAKSNVSDRVIGTRAARSKAARNAKRGITGSKEPSAQQIADEVHKQTLRTTVQTTAQNIRNLQQQEQKKKTPRNNRKAATTTNAMDGVVATETPTRVARKDKVSLRQQQREMNAAAKQLAAVTTVNDNSSNTLLTNDSIPIPTRAMIQAAKTAMINAGYIFPNRTTLHVVPVTSGRTRNNNNMTTTTATNTNTNGMNVPTQPGAVPTNNNNTTRSTGRNSTRRGGGGGGGGQR